MLHAPWGITITNNTETGRALVAKSIISPIGIGDSLANGLQEKGWTLQSLWNKANMNMTIIGAPITDNYDVARKYCKDNRTVYNLFLR